MPNPFYRNHYISLIKAAVAKAQNAANLNHQGVKGTIREILLEEIFKPVIPPHFDFGTGKIMDCFGNESNQIDIAIYSKSFLPPILFGARDGVFPIESCFYGFEVKSKLTKTELQDAIKKAESLFNLILPITFRKEDGKVTFPVVPALFAFDSDLKDKDELERYKECDPLASTNPRLRFLCVVGKGYWYFNTERSDWVKFDPTPDYDEVISMLSGVANTLLRNYYERSIKSFSDYLITEK